MNATLTILTGPGAGHALVADGPAPRTVGRSPEASLTVEDPYLSDVHFAIWCDARGVYARDLESYYGTFVNQQAVREVALRDGDTIQAGQTLFSVRVADVPVVTPAEAAEREDLNLADMMAGLRSKPYDCARWVLQSESLPIYAILDVAHDPGLLDLANESHEAFCAFDETRDLMNLGDFAPMLMHLTPASRALSRAVEVTFGTGNAIFLHCDLPFSEVFGHLSQFVAFDEEGMLTTRQFYDPVVLDQWLSNCSLDEARAFFGPIRTFFAEREDGQAMVRFRLGPDGVVRDELALQMPNL
ncbi:MAG: FHA domain-containing protein [Myxococcales bacterium]|nr:FHA domain-containing protein [Myxococcales bacterium]